MACAIPADKSVAILCSLACKVSSSSFCLNLHFLLVSGFKQLDYDMPWYDSI